MQIVFVNATRIWSGVKTWVLTLSEALARRGHHVSVVAYPGVFADVCQQRGLETFPVEFGFDGNPLVISRLISWFKRHQADVVVTNVEKDIYVAGAAARWVGAKVINHVGAPGEVAAHGRKAWIRSRLIDLFILPSVWASCEAEQNAPWLAQHHLEVLYNPIDTNRFSPLPDGADRESSVLRLGITGRLSSTKGHRTLIEALQLLPPDIRQRVRVEVAGEGPLEVELRQMVAEKNLRDKVQFVGFVTDPERILQQMDMAVFPSLAESFCLAAAEAMSCGLPVIASRVGGLPEVVDDEQNGLLIPPENPVALAQAITRLSQDETLRQQWGRSARKKVERDFSVESIVTRFEALCAEL